MNGLIIVRIATYFIEVFNLDRNFRRVIDYWGLTIPAVRGGAKNMKANEIALMVVFCAPSSGLGI